METIDTLQSLIIPPGTERTDLINQLNARLVAISRLGSRYGGKGEGFYIDSIRFEDIYDFQEDSDSFGVIVSAENTCRIQEMLSEVHIKEGADYPGAIAAGIFGSFKGFLQEHYASFDETTEVRIEIPKSASLTLLYSTVSDNPVALYERFYIPSDSFSVCGEPIFNGMFTVAVSASWLDPADEPEHCFGYKADISGLGLTDEGLLTFDGKETAVNIRGKDGVDSQTIIISGERKALPNNEFGNLSAEISMNGRRFDFELPPSSPAAVASGGPEESPWTDLNGNRVTLLIPSDSFLSAFSQSGNTLYNGAVIFSFLKETDPEDAPTVHTGMLVYRGEDFGYGDNGLPGPDNFEPVFAGGRVFTFGSLFTSSSLSNEICQQLEEYFAGKAKRNREYFAFKKIRFEGSSQTVFQTARNDTSVTDPAISGSFSISLADNALAGSESEPLPVLMLKYSEVFNDFREMLKDPDIFGQVTSSVQFNRGYSSVSEPAAGMNTVLPIIYLNDTSLFCPNAINSLRVYGAGADCGATSENMPFTELSGNSCIWSALDDAGNETIYARYGTGKRDNQIIFKEEGSPEVEKQECWSRVTIYPSKPVQSPYIGENGNPVSDEYIQNETKVSGEGIRISDDLGNGESTLINASGVHVTGSFDVTRNGGLRLINSKIVKLVPKYRRTAGLPSLEASEADKPGTGYELNTSDGASAEGTWSYSYARRPGIEYSAGIVKTPESDKHMPLIQVDTDMGAWIVDIEYAVGRGYAKLFFKKSLGNSGDSPLEYIELAFIEERPVCAIERNWLSFCDISEIIETADTQIYP